MKKLLVSVLMALALPGTAYAGNLLYKGGSVSHKPVVHNIYWQPAGYTYGETYVGLIDRFVADISADSGKSTNAFAVGSLYGDKAGAGAYNYTYAGDIVDTNPYHDLTCTNYYATICMSNIAPVRELVRLRTALNLPIGVDNQYTFYLPQDVAYQGAYTSSCGYHNAFKVTTKPDTYMVFAAIAYANWRGKCLASSSPNNDPSADKAISTTSHELLEVQTDPLPTTGWIDSDGREIADKCQGNYGFSLGATLFGNYNQVINNNYYYIQGEWSNQASGCVWHG
jgi:hypothetical protein